MATDRLALFYSSFYLTFDPTVSKIIHRWKYTNRRYSHMTATQLNSRELLVLTHTEHHIGRLDVTTNEFHAC